MIPDHIDDELNKKLRFLLKKHRCTCQFTLTFRYLPIKYNRSRKTQILYMLGFFFLLYFHITLVVPSKLLFFNINKSVLLYRVPVIHLHLHGDRRTSNTLAHYNILLFHDELYGPRIPQTGV